MSKNDLEAAIQCYLSGSFEGKPDFVIFLEQFIEDPNSLGLYTEAMIEPEMELTQKYLIVQLKTFIYKNISAFLNQETKQINEQYDAYFRSILDFLIHHIGEIANSLFKESSYIVQCSAALDTVSEILNINIFELDPISFNCILPFNLERNYKSFTSEQYVAMQQKIAEFLPFLYSMGGSYKAAYFATAIAKSLNFFTNIYFTQSTSEIFRNIRFAFLKKCERSAYELISSWQYLDFAVDDVGDDKIIKMNISKIGALKFINVEYLYHLITPFKNLIMHGMLDEASFSDKLEFCIYAVKKELRENEIWDSQCFKIIDFFIENLVFGYPVIPFGEFLLQKLNESVTKNENETSTDEEHQRYNAEIALFSHAFLFTVSSCPNIIDHFSEAIIASFNTLLKADNINLFSVGIDCLDTILSCSPESLRHLSPVISYVIEEISFDIDPLVFQTFVMTLINLDVQYFIGDTSSFVEKIQALASDDSLDEESVPYLIALSQFTLVTSKTLTQENIAFFQELITSIYNEGNINNKTQSFYLATTLCEVAQSSAFEFVTEIAAQLTTEITQNPGDYDSSYDTSILCLFNSLEDLLTIYQQNIVPSIQPLLEFLLSYVDENTTENSAILNEYVSFVVFLHKVVDYQPTEHLYEIINQLLQENRHINTIFQFINAYPERFDMSLIHECFIKILEQQKFPLLEKVLRGEFLQEAIEHLIQVDIPQYSSNFELFPNLFPFIKRIVQLSNENIDNIFSVLLEAIADFNQISIAICAEKCFVSAILKEIVSPELIHSFGSYLIQLLQKCKEENNETCYKECFEYFGIVSIKLGPSLLEEFQPVLNEEIASLTEDNVNDISFEYAALYSLGIVKAAIDSGSTEIESNILGLLPSITFTHSYDLLIINILMQISEQECFYSTCAKLFAKLLSLPPKLLSKKEIPTDLLIAIIQKVIVFQTNPDLNQIIEEEAGQFLTLLNERKALVTSDVQ